MDKKLNITLPEDQVTFLNKEAKKHEETASQYISNLIWQKQRIEASCNAASYDGPTEDEFYNRDKSHLS